MTVTRSVILAAALAVAVAAVVYTRSDRSDQASLAAGNYRVLTAAESARLVRFGKVLIYLPVRCLLDQKVVRSQTA